MELRAQHVGAGGDAGGHIAAANPYDDAVRVGVIGNATWANVQGLSVGVLNTTTMFQAAESSCEGAYGSLDGTHLSPTVQVNAAQQVLGLMSIL